MDGGRDLESAERRAIAGVLRREDRLRTELDAVLAERDGMLRALRWGDQDRGPVMPETLMAATRCKRYPDGLSRTTIHRIVGRLRDRLNHNERS